MYASEKENAISHERLTCVQPILMNDVIEACYIKIMSYMWFVKQMNAALWYASKQCNTVHWFFKKMFVYA